ncbi:MAG: hypothetical protein V8S89_01420 [Oscillospiraceae bacterium]
MPYADKSFTIVTAAVLAAVGAAIFLRNRRKKRTKDRKGRRTTMNERLPRYGGVLALISVAACAFTAVTYYRCEKQPEPQLSENELLRILDAGSDAEGVGFEVMRIGGGSVNLPLDLRWKNDSGKTIAIMRRYSQRKIFAAFRREQHPNQQTYLLTSTLVL